MYIPNTHVLSIIYIKSKQISSITLLQKVRLTSSRLRQGRAASNGLSIIYITNTHVLYIICTSQVNRFHPLHTLHTVRLTSSRPLQGRAASNGLTKCI